MDASTPARVRSRPRSFPGPPQRARKRLDPTPPRAPSIRRVEETGGLLSRGRRFRTYLAIVSGSGRRLPAPSPLMPRDRTEPGRLLVSTIRQLREAVANLNRPWGMLRTGMLE